MKAQRVSTTNNNIINNNGNVLINGICKDILSFYRIPPKGDISLIELDNICKARLALLQSIDKKINNYERSNETGGDIIQGFCKSGEADNIIMSIPACLKDNDNDITSHYMLRLAFCRSPELCNWFITCEEVLLQCILYYYGQTAINNALQLTGVSSLINRIIDGKDNSDIQQQQDITFIDTLNKATQGGSTNNIYYEIPFMYCSPNLISKRSVVIKSGMVYLPDTQLNTLLCKTYSEELRKHLDIALQERTVFMSDMRIANILKQMHPTFKPSSNNNDNIPDSEKLSLDNFNMLLERSFPPCMRSLIEQMRLRKTHLKHRGRQQLPPFIRSAGLNMEDSLKWFKNEFTRDQTIDGDKFDRHYSYDIKWVYGKVGRMKPSQAFSCSSIIGFEYPTSDQIHGCPFKNMDDNILKKTLNNWAERAGHQASSQIMIDDIVKRSKRESQLACQEWFRIMHPGSSGDGVGNHPNSYFSESIAYHLPKETAIDKMDGVEEEQDSSAAADDNS